MEATFIKPSNKGTKQLFKNPLLERLTRTHIGVPVTIFFVYSCLLLYWSFSNTSLTLLTSTAIFFAGFIFFYVGGIPSTPTYFSHGHFLQMEEKNAVPNTWGAS
jgi:hypothetical protein